MIRGAGAVRAELDRLLRESDVISLHLPRTPETVGIIGARELTLVKPTSVLINVARGHLVDEGAFLSALEQGALAGAGLDVLIDEPPSCNHPLVQHPKVLITPHMGWYSTSAFVELRMKGIAAVVDVLSGRRPRYVVAEPRGVQD